MSRRNRDLTKLVVFLGVALSILPGRADDEPTPAKRPRPAQTPTTFPPLPKGSPGDPLPSAARTGDSASTESTKIEPERPTPDRPAATEKLRQRYPDGSTMIEREVVQDANGNYVQNGSWKMWDPEGVLVVTGECRDNQFHGEWKRILTAEQSPLLREEPYVLFAGPYVSEATFDDGLLHGRWVISAADGTKISEIEFADGHRHGRATWWYPNGQVMQQVPFRNGTVDGTIQHWTIAGDPDREEQYVAGRRLIKIQHHDAKGQLRSEVSYLHPQLVLQLTDDWWTSQLARFAGQGERQAHGDSISWYANGQKQAELHYDQGSMDGQQRWWYADGQLATQGTFAQGKPHGQWIWYHRNGQKAVSGNYEAGATIGDWIWWSQSGAITRKDSAEPVSLSAVETPPSQPRQTQRDDVGAVRR